MGTQLGCASRPALGQTTAHGEPLPVVFPLRAADGSPFDLRTTHGKPLLIFLFATFDTASQMALTPLEQLLTAHPELRALGIAVQPDPSGFLQTYASSLGLSFPLTYDPDQNLMKGTTALGRVEVIPSYVLLNGAGQPVAAAVGGLDQTGLEALLKAGNLP